MNKLNSTIIVLLCIDVIAIGYSAGVIYDDMLKPNDPSIDMFRNNCFSLDSNFRMTTNWIGFVVKYSCWNQETGESMLGSNLNE